MFRLACATGMRRGELVALRWTSLDANSCLYVDRGIVDEVGGSVEKAPKNGNPRYVAFDAETLRAWKAYRQEVLAWCAAERVAFDETRTCSLPIPKALAPAGRTG